MKTHYVVQAYTKGKRGLEAAEPRQAQTESQALRLAERLASTCVGVVAFSRAGDIKTGDWEDAVILAKYGALPSEEMEGAA